MTVNAVSCLNSMYTGYRTSVSYSCFKSKCGCDTVCFTANKEFLDLPEKEIVKKIRESLNYKYFLGQGTKAEVYRIQDTDYCVKIPYLANNISKFKYSKELTPIDKVNHVVAKLGYGIYIMKYFEGETPKDYKNNEQFRLKFQEKISQMPTKSYSELLRQIANGIDNGMSYDFSGGNLIVNFKENKLTAIDFIEISDKPRAVNPLNEMFSVLTCYGTKKEISKNISDKIMLAALEEFNPEKIPCIDTELFDFECLSKSVLEEKHLKVLTEQFKKLKKIKKSEIINKSLSPVLKEQIKVIKILLKL